MKKILLQNLPDTNFPADTPEHNANLLSWSEAIKQIIRKPLDGQKGADIEEIRKGIRVLDAIDKAQGGVLELEDSDWDHLKEKTQAMQWAFVDRRILSLIDDIMMATDTVTLNAELQHASTNGQVAEEVAF